MKLTGGFAEYVDGWDVEDHFFPFTKKRKRKSSFMDEMTSPETISNALQIRPLESWPIDHARRAIENAKACDSTKARVEIEALEMLLPKAHRCSS